ncbi:MAG TPA: sensor domain-containing protein, partial [Tepidiformaceae bacterium]|nr:sensor domain-containing protein [Tepidiformaceae bacterium]
MTYPIPNPGSLTMTANQSLQDTERTFRGGIPRDPGGMARWFFQAPFRREPWLAAIYLLLEFPIGIAAFVYGVVMLSVGAGTIIVALAGLVLLALFMYSLQIYGELQRQLSNNLLGTDIAPLPFNAESGPLWSRTRLAARFTNTMTWRLLAFLFVRFPLSIVGFVIVMVLVSFPIGAAASPLIGEFGGHFLWVDSWHTGIPLALASPLLAILSLNLLWGAGWVSGLIARLFLQTRYAGISDEGPTVVERAKAALGAWSNPGAPVVLDDGTVEQAVDTESRSERAEPAEPEQGLMVDVSMRRVRVNGRPVELTPKEFDLLALFAQNPGRPFARDELLDRIWRNDYEVTDRTIDTHVQRLRKKLGN